ncbi:uncharacterized protein LOC119523526 [Choloepus didactylus]|uniref:uncharacterized protein LOC119523526 n=1 Tax=Choloepus didactylus TaxID=27675 RepID=UPI0018A08572|nr:uncharacterized protein LOC119523526 [Choloepus didactylus]
MDCIQGSWLSAGLNFTFPKEQPPRELQLPASERRQAQASRSRRRGEIVDPTADCAQSQDLRRTIPWDWCKALGLSTLDPATKLYTPQASVEEDCNITGEWNPQGKLSAVAL